MTITIEQQLHILAIHFNQLRLQMLAFLAGTISKEHADKVNKLIFDKSKEQALEYLKSQNIQSENLEKFLDDLLSGTGIVKPE